MTQQNPILANAAAIQACGCLIFLGGFALLGFVVIALIIIA